MKYAPLLFVSVCFIHVSWSQPTRDTYRAAYAQWQATDPNLERDAIAPSRDFAARSSKLAEGASRYGVAHAQFLKDSAKETQTALQPIEAAWTGQPLIDPNIALFVDQETKLTDSTIKAFANDRDPGIVQVRQALDRERSALAALKTSMDSSAAAAARAASASKAAEAARAEALKQGEQLSPAILEAAALVDSETAAWSKYYSKLASLTPVISAAPVPLPAPARVPAPAPAPVDRYSGRWSFPTQGGIFSGPKPSAATLAVTQNAGRISGTFDGTFLLPAGSKTLRFKFSGPLGAARTQRYDLEASDGAKGSIELIPGAGPALLEINFHTDAAPGKIQQGNMILVKE